MGSNVKLYLARKSRDICCIVLSGRTSSGASTCFCSEAAVLMAARPAARAAFKRDRARRLSFCSGQQNLGQGVFDVHIIKPVNEIFQSLPTMFGNDLLGPLRKDIGHREAHREAAVVGIDINVGGMSHRGASQKSGGGHLKILGQDHGSGGWLEGAASQPHPTLHQCVHGLECLNPTRVNVSQTTS